MITHYSHSSSTTFRRCTYKFNEMYVHAKEDTPPEAPSRGSRMGKAGHLALKAWYSGKSYQVAEDWAYQEFNPQSEEDLQEFNRLRRTLTFYWSNTLTDRWTVELVEEEVKVKQYMGILDLVVVTPSGQRYIVDHKFQKSKSTSHLDSTPQVSFYLMLARELDLKVDGLLYNIILTNSEKPVHPVRKICYRSPHFLDNFQRELDIQIEQMKEFQKTPVPIRNFTETCTWECPIREHCLHEMERPWRQKTKG